MISWQRSHRQQEEMLWEHLHRSLHISTMMFCSERTGTIEDIDLKTRSIITVVALMAQGITDSSLKFHLQNAKDHGVTQKEIAAIITHVAFYAGWPKGMGSVQPCKGGLERRTKEIYHTTWMQYVLVQKRWISQSKHK